MNERNRWQAQSHLNCKLLDSQDSNNQIPRLPEQLYTQNKNYFVIYNLYPPLFECKNKIKIALDFLLSL